MTNWEKSCIEALITSPIAFSLFRDKQKNKKHVDQFINKIWPYKIKKVFKTEQKEQSDIFDEILKRIMIARKHEDKSDEIDLGMIHLNDVKGKKLIEIFNKNMKIRTCYSAGNCIIRLEFQAKTGRLVRMYVRGGLIDYREEITEIISESTIYTEIKMAAVGGRVGTDEAIDAFLSCVNKNKKSRGTGEKFKRKFIGQNVGIEIEYDGIWHNYLEKELVKTKNAISFNSGIDGGCANGEDGVYLNSARLRENRLRINGHRGLDALHFLLEEMNKTNSIMTTKSGMHFHIDLTYQGSRNLESDPNWKLLNSTELELLHSIFEIKNSDRHIKEQIRFPTEFNTMEWRMGSPTLNYSKLAIEILTAIHVTNVITKKNKQINSEYLKCLLDIKTKLILK